MKRAVLILTTAALAALWLVPAAQASYGLKELDLAFENEGGSAAPQAGAHPFALKTAVSFNTRPEPALGFEAPDGDTRNLTVAQMPGLIGNPTAVPRCTNAEFLSGAPEPCPVSSEVGTNDVTFEEPGFTEGLVPVYSLVPPPGVAMKLGFTVSVAKVPVTIEVRLSESPPYNAIATLTNVANVVPVYRSVVRLWGVPAAEGHDSERIGCGPVGCSVEIGEKPFLSAPRACTGPLATTFEATSWQGAFFKESIFTHDSSEPPVPLGMIGCGELGFSPSISAQPTSKAASSPTGLDFGLDVKDEGLTNPEGLAGSDIRKAVVTLPEGMTANPSLAEGLAVCSEEDLKRETASSPPGAGCPEASKIGTVEVETPLLEGELLKGSLFIAKPYENPFGSLLALYMTVKDPALGISVRLAGRVEPDPRTGQLITTFGEPGQDLPQLPFSHFRTHFREGGRSPLISPPGCGPHTVEATLYPWAGGPPLTTTSTFQTIAGPNEGPCPGGGPAPFHPGFEAGSVNNQAGAFSPFDMRLTRKDGEQDMTKFSAVLPPGVTGKIAGLSRCPEAAIAQAKSRTGPHGGTEELEHPSCPASSKIGRTLAGAGVGSQLTYVPGSLYLAGPYNGDPLSVVAIVPALAGPFDAGTVVVRVALAIDPLTAQVQADGSRSDPIPHILKGIPLNVRDLRVYADRPAFTLNPTDCEASKTAATLFGSFLNPLDPADDVPVGLSARYQAANCASLGFKPKLAIALKGGTRRGSHPALTATVTTRPGDANFQKAVVTLPHSAFLDQAHIRTICTRVQFAAGGGNGEQCPAGSVYGHATAWTPVLDEPAQGPVFLRSSNHNLPDLVVALTGPPSAAAKVDLSSRIDSKNGGIRSTFEAIPDFPVSKFVLEMQGGKKGLIVNSTGLCGATHRANAVFGGQNGRGETIDPPVRSSGCKGKGRRGGRAGH
jgi:hypothetical protein